MAERLAARAVLPLVGRTFRRTARLILPLALVVFVPLGLLEAATDHLGGDEEDLDSTAAALLVVGASFQALVATLGDEFYTGVVTAAVVEERTGSRPALAELARTIPYLRLFLVDLVFSLGLALGLLLLVVPGVIFFARYALAAPLVEIEHLGVRAAFRRSRELSRGNGRTVLALLGGIWLLTAVVTEGLQGAIGESFLGDWALAVAIGVILTPVGAVAAAVLAYRLSSSVAPVTSPSP